MMSSLVAIAAALCVVLAVACVVAALVVMRAPAALDAPHRLGAEMGLEQLNRGSRRVPVWYGGTHDGRPFAVTFVNLQNVHTTTQNALWYLSLRVVLATRSPPLGVVAYRRHDMGEHGLSSLAEGFQLEHVDRLGPTTQMLLLDFARAHGGIRLRDRRDAPANLLVPEVAPDAGVILVHDEFGSNQAADDVRRILDGLTEIAVSLEEGAP